MSRHDSTATHGAPGLSRGERRMQELLNHLKAVESSRDRQLPLLESINRRHARLGADEPPASAQQARELSGKYTEARDLAQREQQAADAALDIVGRLLARMDAREAEQLDAERQLAKRPRTDRHSSPPARAEPSSRGRRSSRAGDSERPALLDRRRASDVPPDADALRREPRRDRDRSRDARRSLEGHTHARDRSHDRASRRDTDDARLAPRVISKGSLVAVRVATSGGEAGEEWILATVLTYSAEKNRYTVQDYDVESPVRPTYVLSPRLVLFVTADPANASTKKPLWNRTRNPEMARGQRVLALYPRTTAFYQCSVVVPPSRNTVISGTLFPPAPGVPMGPADPSLNAQPDPIANPMYKVQFDDDDNKEVDVPAHLVIPMPRSG
ncbi:hypothetical protein H4S02_002055 [Coemansia sp. RSA 2611]|nr:hypothetical protein H4S01_002394 [Coemansia sp. RSA 2610]KAJ2390060.1 hypothetical protein H4S02_002055 [Coemansia sp. RSA 2611]